MTAARGKVSEGEFGALFADVAADRERWLGLWREWPEREVHAHPSYAALYADERTRAAAVFMRGPDFTVLYPFMLRDLRGADFWGPDAEPAYHLITPYGYGGPFRWGSASSEAAARRFWPAFAAWAAERAVASEFVRLSLFPEKLLPYPGEVEKKLDNVVRDLAPELESMWMEFAHKVRKNVNRAQRDGVEVVIDERGERLEDFLTIYESTMDRRDAERGYYFPRSYFERIVAELPGESAFFHARLGGKIVSTELVLVSADNLYSFLGGTVAEAFPSRPNDLLKHEIIRWGKQAGKRRFVFGGGYQPDDGIFRYKLAFAPRGVMPYFVGHRILDPEKYEQLRAARARWETERRGGFRPDPGYFPEYLAPNLAGEGSGT